MGRTLLLTAICVSIVLAQAPKKTAGGDAGKGKAVFEQCAVCHDAGSTTKKLGPGLKGLFKRAKLQNGKPANDANVRAIVEAGGNGMPPYKELLSAPQKEDLMAYLKTL